MTLASMHPIFQVSIDFVIHSSSNYVWKIHVHIVVLAKPKLQLVPSQSCKVKIARVIEIWKCLLDRAKIGVHLCFYLQTTTTVFCDKQLWERLSL